MTTADTDPTQCSNLVLRQATRRMGQLYDDAIAPSGIKATQYGLLAFIFHLGEASSSQLAEALVMDLSALGHSLKPLIRDGLVEMFQNAQDRRVKQVRLTPHGKDRFMEATRLWQAAQANFETAFGVERAADLRSVLSYVASAEFGDIFLETRADKASA